MVVTAWRRGGRGAAQSLVKRSKELVGQLVAPSNFRARLSCKALVSSTWKAQEHHAPANDTKEAERAVEAVPAPRIRLFLTVEDILMISDMPYSVQSLVIGLAGVR